MNVINHTTINDNRGSYTPISTTQLNIQWDQCSISINHNRGTFRGLHYQTNPPQTKYIKVIQGRIIDFLYNLQTKELQHFILNNNQAILVSDNMAHGFLTLEDNTIVTYMVKGEYNPESEHSIIWNQVDEVKSIIQDKLNQMNVEITISDKDQFGK